MNLRYTRIGTRVATDSDVVPQVQTEMKGTIMDWNDWEQDTPSIRSLLYDRGGLLFEEHASITDYDTPLDEWSDEPPEFE